jgi:replicative DNA helicase
MSQKPMAVPPGGRNVSANRPGQADNMRFINATAGYETAIPYSVEAEEAVIGALLIDREAILSVINIIKPSDFFQSEYALIFEAVALLYMDGFPCDLVTLRDRLGRADKLGDQQGQVKPSTILHLMRSTPSPVHIVHHARIVKEYAIRRRAIARQAEYTAAFCDKTTALENLLAQELERVREEMAWLKDTEQNTRILDHSTSLTYLERMEARRAELKASNEALAAALGLGEGGRVPRMRFGWRGVDGGDADDGMPKALLQRSTFATLIAKTSVGKTIFGESVAEANARAGIDVLYVMTELNTKQMEDRRICRYSDVPYMALALEGEEGNVLVDWHERELARAMNEINSWPGREDFFYASGLTATEILDEIRSRQLMLETTLKRRYRLVIIDYIGRIDPPKGYERASEADRTKSIIKTLSDGATQMQIAMLCLSQVTREAAKSEEGLKQESGIGSSAIEQCSNIELAIERVKDDKDKLRLVCLKNTFGSTDWSVDLKAEYSHYRFTECAVGGDDYGAARPLRTPPAPTGPARRAAATATRPDDMGWDEPLAGQSPAFLGERFGR